jgi:KUP system potassium uptake protein
VSTHEGGSTHHGHSPVGLNQLTLAALGVVFGDIGTSPLYALKECLSGPHGAERTPENILGVLSLILWSLLLVVAVKYLGFVMRADNRGEGGILALLALAPERLRWRQDGRVGWVAAFVLFGAALLYGDGILTPAISVLGAVEGLGVAAPALAPWILPITCALLVGLFAVQRLGTGAVGRAFGPVMVAWFLTLGGLGVWHLLDAPHVLAAIWPGYGLNFLVHGGWHSFLLLGSVFLSVTGGEALYADMGHFGVAPIRRAWWALVLPALVLNYFGQGAMLLADPTVAHPFFGLVPQGAATWALVLLATCAAIIASQALISGVYSLTRQAVQLGCMPRVEIRHTSASTEGQIYVPAVNWALMVACLILVVSFGETSKLAGAYGIAVTGTMGITSVVFAIVAHGTWGWPLTRVIPLLVLFLAFDIPFLAANMVKVADGGFVPLVVGAAIFGLMVIWRTGRSLLEEQQFIRSASIESFMTAIGETAHNRLRGLGVFMAGRQERIPPSLSLVTFLWRSRFEYTFLLSVRTTDTPFVTEGERWTVVPLAGGAFRVIVHTGFMEIPDVPSAVAKACQELGLPIGHTDVTYVVGHETIVRAEGGLMAGWAESLFALMSRNAEPATRWFRLPPRQVIEIGSQYDL